MILPEKILLDYKATLKQYKKDEYIFYEDDNPDYYYQINKGVIKMSSYSSNGQEFIQGIFKSGRSFGEPPLFGNFTYPNNAIAMEDSTVYRLPSAIFFGLLSKNYELHRKFNQILSERLRYKAIILKEISSYCPDHIILTLLNYIRDNSPNKNDSPFLVPNTRQQLADMCGLRVETVIRNIKKLQNEGKIIIKEHKIYL
jgi:CRP-like cAMP-binding protein